MAADANRTRTTPRPLELGAAQTAVQKHAESFGLTTEAVARAGRNTVDLRVEYPEGRAFRAVFYDERAAQRLLSHDLSPVRFLPEINGYVLTDTGDVEVRVLAPQSHRLRQVPGFEDLDPQRLLFEEGNSDGEPFPSYRLPEAWRITVAKDTLSAEISPASPKFRAVLGTSARVAPTITLKISGLKSSTTDATMAAVQRLSDALFFDIDVRYHVTLELFDRPHFQFAALSRMLEAPPEFPKNRYHSQPTALYRYGRSARSLPLLAYLSFYQVLEFFFPIFMDEEITRRARQILASPQFDSNDELSLLRLVDAIKPNARSSASERDQLRVTIRRCFGAGELERILASDERFHKHFTERPQPIAALAPLRNAHGSDIRDSVADRIYDIRCRIVHTKSDGGDQGVELLLPTGKEARSLGPDIELVRLAAQQAIVAGSAPLDLG